MDPIVQAILALLITFSPLTKPSPYSFEVLAECGTDPEAPACDLEPQCQTPSHFACAPPRWSDARGGWVVVETREGKLRRMVEYAETLRAAALWHTRCRDRSGAVTEACWPTSKWPEGPSTLVMAAATAVGWESGMREDIRYGYAPMGRGPGGEACPMQLMPEQVLPNATWLPPKERDRLLARMNAAELREWGARAVLDGPEALFRCFAAGMNMLSRSRRACATKGPWVTGMFSMYGTGSTCNAAGIMDDFHLKRAKTFRDFQRMWDPLGKPPMLDPAILAELGTGAKAPRAAVVDPRLCSAE